MWIQIQAVLLLLFFLFFQFNSFYYTPPNRNYTKKEIEEMIQKQREKNKPDFKSQEQENNNATQIEQEFPGDDVGVKYFEEECEDLKQTIFVENNTIIESDEEKIVNQNDDLSEEYSYYYEYEYEIVYEEQFQEEIDSNETQQNDQSTYPEEEVNSMLSQNGSLSLSNSTQIHFETNQLITQQNFEGLPNDFEDQKMTTEIDKKIQENVNSSQNQFPQILLEVEWVEEEYYEEEIKDNEEIYPEEILIYEDQSQQILQKNETSLSNQPQYKGQDFKQYFARICYINENQLPIKQQPKLEEESERNLWIHSFVLTMIAIYLHFKNRKTQSNKEEIQSQIIELNEYMTMMLERLEQQYYLIIKSQEQLTYQLELLEQ